MKRKILSLITAVSMILSAIVLPQTASAATTTASSIELGDYVKMGTYNGTDILWRCVAFEKITGTDSNGNPITDPTQTVKEYQAGYLPLMLADTGLCKKEFDAAGGVTTGSHARNISRKDYGSNYWGDSNIRDWLNSSDKTVTYTCGNSPSYKDEAGFLTNFSNDEKAAIQTVTQKSLLADCDKTLNTAGGNECLTYKTAIEEVAQNYATAYAENLTDTMFLLDVRQLYNVYKNGGDLGSAYYMAPLSYTYCLLRSPSALSAYSVRFVGPAGIVNTDTASNGQFGVRPAFYLNPTAKFLGGSGAKATPYTLTAPPHKHTLCGIDGCTDANHNHTEVTFEPLPDNYTGGVLSGGSYYLTKDIALTDWIDIRGAVKLCLNGYKITQTAKQKVIYISTGSLDLCDCAGGGQITGGENNISGGSGISTGGGTTLNMYGGTVCGNTTTSERGGGGVNAGGTFHMYGGKISDNTITGSNYGAGGGVITSGSFTMYGGEISGNTISNGSGGGVSVTNGGTFTFIGGSIINNTSKSGNGGGIAIGTVGSIKLRGGEITGNKCAQNGGGVFFGNGSLSISGNLNISNNDTTDKPLPYSYGKNIYLHNALNSKIITIDGELTYTSPIGISVYDEKGQVFTDGWNTHMSGRDITDYFVSDKSDMSVGTRTTDGKTEGILGYTVSYDKPSGVTGTQPTDNSIYLKGETATVADSAYTKDGYKQTGWSVSDKSTATVESPYTITGSTVFYPVFARGFEAADKSDTIELTYNKMASFRLSDYLQFATGVTDTTKDFTFALANGSSLPAGLTLNPTFYSIIGTPTELGSYTVSFDVTDKKSFTLFSLRPTTSYQTGTLTLTLNITKPDGTASVTMENYTCGETSVNPVPASDTNGTENVTYQYKLTSAADTEYSDTKPSTAGEYTVKATFAQTDTYNAVTATDTFMVRHNPVHHEAVDAACTTNGTKEYWKCEGTSGGCGKMFSDAQGNTEISAIPVIPAKNHNYGKWEFSLTETATEVIKTCANDNSHQIKRNAEIQLVIPEPYIYNGAECKPKASVKVLDGTEETVLSENTDYTLSYENNINAGTAKVTITGKGDYSGTVERMFHIGAKPLNVTAANADNKTYDGTNFVHITAVTLDGVCGGDTVAIDTDNLTGTIETADAGEYTQVTLSNLSLVNNQNNNYILNQANITLPTTVTIEQADVPAVTDGIRLNIANNLEKEYSYLLSRLCPTINEEGTAVQKNWGERSYEIVSIAFGQDGYYDADTARIDKAENPSVSGGEADNTLYLPVKFNDTQTQGKVAEVTIRITSKNYKPFDNKFEIHAVNKKAVTFGGITAQNAVYNGSPQQGYTGELTVTDSDGNTVALTPEIRYAGRLETGYSEKEAAPTNAGTYSIIFRVADTDETYIGKNTFNFEIARAQGNGSVTMADFKYGEEPSVPVPVSATNGTDNVTYLYKVQDAADSAYTSEKPTKAGIYTVKATFAQTVNYNAFSTTANFTINHDYSDKWSHDISNHWHECSCGSKTEVGEHIWNTGVVTQEATCTLEGRTRFACTVCGREKVETFAPLGHGFGAWTITAEPTLTATGIAERICARNSEHKENATLPALSDTSVWTPTNRVEPTEDADGLQEYTSEYGTVTIIIPKTQKSTAVIVKDGAPKAEVSGLDALAEKIANENAGAHITLTLTISKADVQADIQTLAGNQKTEYFDLTLIQKINDTETKVSESGSNVKIVLPFDTSRKNIVLYQYYNSSATAMSTLSTDAEYYEIGDGEIIFYANKMSTYAIGYDEKGNEPSPAPRPTRGGGSGTSSYKMTFDAAENGQPADDPAKTPENPFTDIASEYWYYRPVLSAYANGLMKGVTDTEFAPLMDITRGMFITVLYRMEGEPDTALDYTFEDVSADEYYANAVAWGNANGIILGYSAQEYAPDQIITREQMAAIIYRYAGYKGHDLRITGNINYTDKESISAYAFDAVAWAADKEIMVGHTDNTFTPQNHTTRAEAAAVFERVSGLER